MDAALASPLAGSGVWTRWVPLLPSVLVFFGWGENFSLIRSTLTGTFGPRATRN